MLLAGVLLNPIRIPDTHTHTHTPNRSTNQERALHCFERVAVAGKEDVGQSYGMAAALTPYSCREEVVDLLVKVRGPC